MDVMEQGVGVSPILNKNPRSGDGCYGAGYLNINLFSVGYFMVRRWVFHLFEHKSIDREWIFM